MIYKKNISVAHAAQDPYMALAGVRRLFYAVTPAETSYPEIEDVPRFVDQAVPFFIVAILLEGIVLRIQGKGTGLVRINDAFSSLAAGMISQLPNLLVRSIEISVYIWLYKHASIVHLPWDSPWTWWLAFFGVDLGYYWFHRLAHEVNLMWAAHQVHHSSEEYNLSTALRQSILQKYFSWVFYLPMALAVPPSIFLVHVQFNLLYQFWIHTQTIKTLGPLEYILNTPSHHRVHHGRNRYCIDKNYAGTLIIWDRIFGTFEAEKDEVVYGVTHPLNTWDPVYTQFCHLQYTIEKAWNIEGLGNKLSVIFKGPGWDPGKPRTGLLEDIPDVSAPTEYYDRSLPLWGTVYVMIHFFLSVMSYNMIFESLENLSQSVILLYIFYLVWTLVNVGNLYEGKSYAQVSEFIRCTVYLIADSYACRHNESCPAGLYVIRVIFLVSSVVWGLHCARLLEKRSKKTE